MRYNGAVIDPFHPSGKITCGEAAKDSLWKELPPYRPGGIITTGTSADVPDFSAIRANRVAPPEATSNALVIYAFLFGIQKDDVIRLSLRGPLNTIIERDTQIERTQAQSFRAIGKKRANAPRWPAGEDTGAAILLRAGTVIDSRNLTFNLP